MPVQDSLRHDGAGVSSVDAQFARLRFVDMDLLEVPDMFKTGSEYSKYNRWQDVMPNETTLFPPLPPPPPVGSKPFYYPYLNANFVDPQSFYGIPHAFVACQAPIPKQFEDFWYVVGQYRVPLIVMLTQEVEKRAQKAHAYWPKKVGEPTLIWAAKPPTAANSGPSTNRHIAYILTMTREKRDSDDIIRRSFDMNLPVFVSARGDKVVEGDSQHVTVGELVHRVEHIQYLGWPDFGVPKDSSAFVSIVKQIQKTPLTSSHYIASATGKSESASRAQYIHDLTPSTGHDLGTGPVFTHCSAGIGRAGTLLATYICLHLQSALKRDITAETVFEVVKQLKLTRSGMVQRPEQLAFVYKCLGVKM